MKYTQMFMLLIVLLICATTIVFCVGNIIKHGAGLQLNNQTHLVDKDDYANSWCKEKGFRGGYYAKYLLPNSNVQCFNDKNFMIEELK